MSNHLTSRSIRLLLGATCIVIISWGIKAAADVLSLVLFGLLLAYSVLPFLKWMMQQFHLGRTVALGYAVGLMGTLGAVLVFLLYHDMAGMKQKLPSYEEHARNLYQHVAAFLQAHGIDIASSSATQVPASNEIVKLAHVILPGVGRLFSDGLAIVLLGGMSLWIIAGGTGRANAGSLLTQIHNDVGHFVDSLAAAGVLTAVANLVLLEALGVDFALVWCVLYFFLQFIPSIGFILSLVPPTCVALLTLGWKKALMVLGGLVLTQLVSMNVIAPLMLRKKGVRLPPIEKMLSLMWWGFLLGPAGAILAVPLTLAMKRCIPDLFIERNSAAPSE